ncbi:DUF2946 domain-containing protein [Derxia lacustris]|uniref:DUF2946 domain-containing protein n=1 Tax=Derxia lacustris TaxID=764842 RepID=UPI001592FEAA|nr:DUF2946 domain-containing protein [Derxia lacustris]
MPFRSVSALRRLALGLACLAMLMAALAPTVSRWLAAQAEAPLLVEVCRADGSRSEPVWLRAAPAEADHSHDSHGALQLDHCGYCVNPAGGHGLLPPAPVFALFGPASHALPALFLHSAQPLPIWRSANPRAPPLLA